MNLSSRGTGSNPVNGSGDKRQRTSPQSAAKAVARSAAAKVTRSKETSASAQKEPPVTKVSAAMRDCGVYIEGKRLPGNFDHYSGLAEVRRFGEGFTWLSLSRPNAPQMDAIADVFGLDELTVEDALTTRQRPKIEIHDKHIVFVVRSIHYSPEGLAEDENEFIRSGQLLLVVGKEFVITIRMGMPSRYMVKMTERAENNPQALAHGPMGVLWALTDELVDNYLRIAHLLEDRVEDMEDEVFEPQADSDIEEVYILKREILEMRHAIEPLTSALRTVMNLNEDRMPKEIQRLLSDVLDHQLVAADMVQGLDERLSALIDAAAVKIQIQQNKDMRTISAYAAILAVPTALAGIYGMNFTNMPELNTQYGYFVVIAVMIIMVAILVYVLRRNKWL